LEIEHNKRRLQIDCRKLKDMSNSTRKTLREFTTISKITMLPMLSVPLTKKTQKLLYAD
jgi:hypothetical protein